jgi:hypothetical protein
VTALATKHRFQLSRYAMLAAALACCAASACIFDEAPQGLRRTPPGPGATVRFDMLHKPLPDIPIPNDLATWPDPTSRTGLRINASLIAPTEIETIARKRFSEMEGWGTFGWITVSFDPMSRAAPRAALDLDNVKKRHRGDDFDFANDAVYLVNLRTGVPVPVDLGEGINNYTLREKQKYWPNDPRRSEQNLLFETYDEVAKAGGATAYEPRFDSDFDGVLDRPNLDSDVANLCPPPPDNPDDPNQLERDQCIADHFVGWYERETDSLIIRPAIPLEEMTTYAVVLTDRLLDGDGHAIKSPFEFVYHPMQERGIARLRDHMANPSLARFFGDIGGTGLEHVAFAWTFTTQPVYDDLRRLRDGLYGTGPFGYLGTQFPPVLHMERAVGLYDKKGLEDDNVDTYMTAKSCQGVKDNFTIVHYDAIKNTLKAVFEQVWDLKGPERDGLMEAFDAVDYLAIGNFQSPFFVAGGPKGTDPNAAFHLNYLTGQGDYWQDTVWFWMTVPKKKYGAQPFPINFYGHGYTGDPTEIFVYAGHQARQGIATVGVAAVGHGMSTSDAMTAKPILKGGCLGPFSDAIMGSRARDLNNDGKTDSGGDFWTSYIFHTRDVVRQSVLDYMQATRIFRSFTGKERVQDYDGDGKLDIMGDFDADGTVDVGGPYVPITTWGESLGGILSGIMGGIDPTVIAAAPTSGGGGLIDIGVRSFQGGVVEAVVLRLIGPILFSEPVGDKPDPKRTACAPGQIAIRWMVPDLNDDAQVEVACVDSSVLATTGGTVVLRNGRTGQARCARSDANGRFRVAIPANIGDGMRLEVYSVPDNVDSYGTCNVRDASKLTRAIGTWSSALLKQGQNTATTPACDAAAGCVRFQGREYAVGSALVAPAEGYGYIRQTPSLRRFIGLAQHAIDPADPINYAPYYAIKGVSDPWGNVLPARALLTINTIGDMNVPVNSGINYGRASGALPFFTPDQAKRWPEYADYATPPALYEQLGKKTPNRVLIDNHVVEGIARLQRHPAGAACHANEVPISAGQYCHPTGCSEQNNNCHGGQRCVDGVCRTVIDPNRCKNALSDPEDLDEGLALYEEYNAKPPLRLARLSANATVDTLDAIWAPRLMGQPYAGTDVGAWNSSRRVTAMLNAYIVPQGVHCFDIANPCENWNSALYLINMVTRFFATEGRDLYYLSHPATHGCLGDWSCEFLKK